MRIRDRTLGIRSPAEGRELAAQVRDKAMAALRRIAATIRNVELPGLDVEAMASDREGDHFAETMLGGVVITLAMLVGTIAVVWIWSWL